MIYASMGRYTEAANLLANVPPEQIGNIPPGQIGAAVTKEAARLLRTAPLSTPAPQSLPQLGALSWVYLHIGAPERALEPFERDVAIGLPNPVPAPWVWHPSWAPGAQDRALQSLCSRSWLRRLLAREGLVAVLPPHDWRRFRVQLAARQMTSAGDGGHRNVLHWRSSPGSQAFAEWQVSGDSATQRLGQIRG